MKSAVVAISLLISVLCLPLQAAPMLTEVIPTQRNAAELVQILKPLVPAPGSINHFQNQLIIKTSADHLAEIQALLKKLDKAPENLLIHVRFSDDSEVRRDLAEARARIRSGNLTLSTGSKQSGSGLNTGIRTGDVNAGLQLQRSLSTRSGNEQHSLRVLEGHQAFIRTGQSIPLTYEQSSVGSFGTQISRGTQFEEFGSGFYVLPRLNGNQVNLEISTQRRRLNGQSNAINSARVQEAATHITGQLGRWMEIAGVNSAAQRRALVSNSSRLRSTREYNNIYVKVERLGR